MKTLHSMSLALAVTATVGTGMAGAQDAMHHGGGEAGALDAPSSQAFAAANDRMHAEMAIEPTGDADVDFARAMSPHHQGAIDMALIELEYGKDPELRKFAEAILEAQASEIAMMEAWLAAKGQ